MQSTMHALVFGMALLRPWPPWPQARPFPCASCRCSRLSASESDPTAAGKSELRVTRWSPAAAFPRGAQYSEEAAMEAFAGLKYWRYYEFWMWQAGKATCGAQIANALWEQEHGVPIVAITPSCPRPEHKQGGHGPCGGHVPKSMEKFFNFSAAAFLVVATPYSYWGFQNRQGGGGGWYDRDKTWHSLYDAQLGDPLGNATVIPEPGSETPMSWTRNFEFASVSVNCSSGEGTIVPKGAELL